MSDGSEQSGKIILSPSALVPLGVVTASVIALFGAKSWLDSQFDTLNASITQVQWELKSLQGASADRWTSSDQRLWAEQLARSNPTLVIPKPERQR